MRPHWMVLSALILVACGCGNNNASPDVPVDPPPPVDIPPPQVGDGLACASMPSNGAELDHNLSSGCLNCSVTDSAKAADGDLETFATVTIGEAVPGQGVSVRAKAPSGVVYPSGQHAGAWMALPGGDIAGNNVAQTYEITIRTYLNGTQQESNTDSSGLCGVCGNSGSFFEGFQTSQPFDAVEVFISDVQVAPSTDFRIYEFCSDHSS